MTYQDKELDFTTPWRRLTVYDGLREYAKIEPTTISETDLLAELKKHDKDSEMASKGEMLMELFEHVVEPHLIQPTFVMDHQKKFLLLQKNTELIQVLSNVSNLLLLAWSLVIHTLNLMILKIQYERLKSQEAKRMVDEEAQPMDEDFYTLLT